MYLTKNSFPQESKHHHQDIILPNIRINYFQHNAYHQRLEKYYSVVRNDSFNSFFNLIDGRNTTDIFVEYLKI